MNHIENAQTASGGWCHALSETPNQLGYTTFTAVTYYALHALAVAKTAGAQVNQQVIDRGIEYVASSQFADNGGIGYSPRSGQIRTANTVRSCGALLTYHVCGKQQHATYPAIVNYVRTNIGNNDGGGSHEMHEGHASADMGLYWAGAAAQELGIWDTFWAHQGERILALQNTNGMFRFLPGDGVLKPDFQRAYEGVLSTSFYALILTIPDHAIIGTNGQRVRGGGRGAPAPVAVVNIWDSVGQEANDLQTQLGDEAPEALAELIALIENLDALQGNERKRQERFDLAKTDIGGECPWTQCQYSA